MGLLSRLIVALAILVVLTVVGQCETDNESSTSSSVVLAPTGTLETRSFKDNDVIDGADPGDIDLESLRQIILDEVRA